MVKIKELLPYIENYLIALVNTRYRGRARALRCSGIYVPDACRSFAALDPDRNK